VEALEGGDEALLRSVEIASTTSWPRNDKSTQATGWYISRMTDRPTTRLLVALLLLACRAPAAPAKTAATITPITTADLQQAAVAAVLAAPWDSDPSGWGTLCSIAAPCDTLIVEPRVVLLPAQAPAFFVPANRPQEVLLTAGYVPPGPVGGKQFRLGDWQACSGDRDTPAWRMARRGCVALGVARSEAPTSASAVTFALMTATPAKGLGWPRVRMTKREGEWHATLLSNATQ
jgi:hypothetical protein